MGEEPVLRAHVAGSGLTNCLFAALGLIVVAVVVVFDVAVPLSVAIVVVEDRASHGK